MKLSVLNFVVFLIPVFGVHLTNGQVKIDHAIAVVKDLEKAKETYTDMGFYVKEGRLHENGLLNAHIKFANRSSFELMSIQRSANDDMSRQYLDLLNEAEGGVYLALTGHHHDSLKSILSTEKIAFTETKGKLWNYLSFPPDSDLAHLFFIEYLFDTGSLKDRTDHPNGMTHLKEVIIEGGVGVEKLLMSIGLVPLKQEEVFVTQTGYISVKSRKNKAQRPRLLRLTFAGPNSKTLEIDWQK